MNHLDEGTIHAWLDGALDATQARDTELHVAQCAACAAAVAEARGLIAGSSRILNALDDVPGGVLPKRAPVPAPARAPRRVWRAAPWVTGIAAVLMAAVVLRTSDKAQTSMENATLMQAPAAESARGLEAIVPPQVAAAPAEAPIREQQRGGTSAERDLKSSKAPALTRETAQRPRPASEVKGQIAGKEETLARTLGDRSQSVRLSEVVVTGAGAESATVAGARAEASNRVAGVTVTASPSKILMDSLSAAANVAADAVTGANRHAGCYRIPSQPESLAAASVSAERQRRAVAGAAPARAAAPSAARMEYSGAALPAIVRLDTARAALGFAVRAADSDSIIGSWQELRDSARVDLSARGVLMLPVTTKVPCPER